MYEILHAKVSKNFDKIAKDDTSEMNILIKKKEINNEKFRFTGGGISNFA